MLLALIPLSVDAILKEESDMFGAEGSKILPRRQGLISSLQDLIQYSGIELHHLLVKGHLKGCTNCCFCTEQETIQHLFFDCPIAQLTLVSVCLTFGVKKSEGVEHLFGPWLISFRVSRGTLCWSVWRPFAGPCGSAGMIWSFKSHNTSLFRM
jgi:hypothetical protein